MTPSEPTPRSRPPALFRWGFLGCLLIVAFIAGSLQPWKPVPALLEQLNLAKFGGIFGGPGGNVDASDRAIPVVTRIATRTSSFEIVRTYAGIIKPRRESELATPTGARLARVLVTPGQDVQAGELMAELETGGLVEQRTQLNATLTQANSELARLTAVVSLPSVQAVENEIRSLRGQLNRLQARVNTNSSQQLQSDVANTQRRIAVLEAATRDERVVAQQAKVQQLNSKLAELDASIEQSKLKAPFDGTVAMRYFDEGATVPPGRPIVRVVDLSQLRFRVTVPKEIAAGLQRDSLYPLEVGSRRLEARLLWVSPEVERTTRTCPVEFELPRGNAAEILAGQVGRLKITERVEGEGVWMPTSALIREAGGLWSFYVVEANEAGQQVVANRMVDVLHQDAQRVRVGGAVQEGDVVITDGTHRVVPGQIVSTLPEYDAQAADSGRSP